jgi:hypothetical protein
MEVDDPVGTTLASDTEAIAYAERIVQDLKEDKDLTDRTIAMIVRREVYGVILTIPLFPN